MIDEIRYKIQNDLELTNEEITFLQFSEEYFYDHTYILTYPINNISFYSTVVKIDDKLYSFIHSINDNSETFCPPQKLVSINKILYGQPVNEVLRMTAETDPYNSIVYKVKNKISLEKNQLKHIFERYKVEELIGHFDTVELWSECKCIVDLPMLGKYSMEYFEMHSEQIFKPQVLEKVNEDY